MSQFANLAAAQRNYDRQIPVEHDAPDFSQRDVELFIADFAATTNGALMDLEDMGIHSDVGHSAEVIRNLCRAWQKNPLAVYELVGVEFWRMCSEMASFYYDKRTR